ncbi:MAG: hypothetical protein AAF126_00385 [Chloroflexota bacterium]
MDNLEKELVRDGQKPEFAKALNSFVGEMRNELDNRQRVARLTDGRTAYGNCRRTLHSLHRIRKHEGLTKHNLKLLKDNLRKWQRYRSNKTFDCVRAYGVWEDPVIYDNEAEVDEYVLEIIEDLEGDFEWCTEDVQMTGRQLGELVIDW